MILLVTNKRDLTTDFIVVELRRRGRAFHRLNTEDLPQASVRFNPRAGGSWAIDSSDLNLRLEDVGAAYYRRPGSPEPAGARDEATAKYLADEWSAVTKGLWNALEGRWLSSPFAILRAEDKPRQLATASALGFDVPETLISNDFAAASAFVAKAGAIGKPLRHSLVERGEAGEVLFTARLDPLKPIDRTAVSLAPVIYQHEVRKAYDVRATVIGDRVFAVAIHSQDHDETTVDWRSGTRLDLRHEAIELPANIIDKCRALTQKLDLRYGAIDLIADQDGRYWFLEINPNGQWAWIERRTGLPLASAIVDELEAISA
ncbi:MvdC/MvdD family ATP grasp protein [Croceicoccus marinus]|uniref:ATP-dependent carboxylate-amine ligase n=1 Tax=Croceicoccus marinus TaxID=450378 RepID=A0A1Z1FG63_9SPHN|nr:ATP-dependent carboxylate-amine ligase [Croceicoccus marinus]ARU17752.1 ATP-dependent carboxylate-amine ligase [Croceicoccus marinus]QNE07219.1 ATP-dependent carboxylate-amine ligase [Croceicoccus marinus]